MEITLNQLQNSKIYVRNSISYNQPNSIIDPIINIWEKNLSNNSYYVSVQNEVVNQNIEGGDNIAYPRFLIENKIEEVLYGDVKYENTMGLLVAMNQQSPVVKVYTGMNVSACTNLCIFNAEHIFQQNLTESLQPTFDALRGFTRSLYEKIESYRDIHMKLINTLLNQEELNEKLGMLLREGVSNKLGTSPIVNAVRLLNNRNSIYHADEYTSLYTLFNAITQSITDSPDILYKPDKTLALSKLLVN